MRAPHLYVIYWGKEWETEPFEYGGTVRNYIVNTISAMEDAIETNSTYQDIAHQYHDDHGQIGTFLLTSEYVDKRVTAPTGVNEEKFLTEVNEAIAKASWPAPTHNSLYLILPARAATFESPWIKESGCGYHGVFNEPMNKGEEAQHEAEFAFIPYAGTGVLNESPYTCLEDIRENHTHQEWVEDSAKETAGTLTHEAEESFSDPSFRKVNAWQNSEGYEIADLCQGGNGGAQKLGPVFGAWASLIWGNQEAHERGLNEGCTIHDAPAGVSPAPVVVTEAATNITPYSGVMNASVNPEGSDTHYFFQTGWKAGEYNAQIPAVPAYAGFGESPVAVNAKIEGLPYATTVHYRIVAESWAGTRYGADKEFTTPYPPPLVRTSPATEVGPSIATLHGEVSSENKATRTTWFEYGTTTGYGSRTSEQQEGSVGFGFSSVEATLTGLSAKTTYHYRLVSSTNGGTTYGSDATVTTTPSPMATTESPTAIGATSATLQGSVNPGGHSTTYQFEYWPTGKQTETKYTPSTAESVGSGTSRVKVKQTVSGLTAHLSYTYRVRANSSAGTTYGETSTFIPTLPLTVETTPKPEGVTEPKLRQVACGSPTLCTATGEGEHAMFVERFNGVEWALQTMPHLAGRTNEWTQATGCSEWMCMVVIKDNIGDVAEVWNGTEWKAEAMPGGNNISIEAVSCVGPAECEAVGQINEGGHYKTFAEHWRFYSWEIQTTPTPSTEYSNLYGVACLSPEYCTAVGTSNNPGNGSLPSETLVEHWNGSIWAIQVSPNPGGSGTNHTLRGISCTATNACTAVGEYGLPGAGGYGHSLAVRWNGTEWAAQSTPNEGGYLGNSGLDSVWCTSQISCIAVGGPFGVAWNGTEWTVQSWSPPAGEGSSGAELLSIACVGQTCRGSGDYSQGTGGPAPLVEALAPPVAETKAPTNVTSTSATLTGMVDPEGHETSYQFEYGPNKTYGTKIPVPEGKLGSVWHNYEETQAITGLKLNETTYHYRIVATNSYGTTLGADHTIAPRTWATLPTPIPSGGTANTLAGVSCPELSTCFAAGTTKNSSGVKVTLAETFKATGEGWSLQTTPNPAGATESSLHGISCTTTSSCTAVGFYVPSGGYATPLAEHWNGTEWKVETPPKPSGATTTQLEGVSCTSTTSCIAVGYYQGSAGDFTLAESWNGTSWTIQTSPNKSSNYNVLNAVSCTSSSACTAVGSILTGLIAERWNGSTWSLEAPPLPTGSKNGTLIGVSCVGTTFCTATGDSAAGLFEPQYQLAEGWNGTSWSLQTVTGGGDLNGVSCTATTACNAVGAILALGTVADAWQGTEWTTSVTANPPTSAVLKGTSCYSSAECVAVGNYTNSSGVEVTLGESFGPPVVNAEVATAITNTTATLNANVNADGRETSYYFEYGPTTAYGATAPVPNGKVTSEVAGEHVSQAITALTPETTYHYRIVAVNSYGTRTGTDHAFTTG